VARFTGYNFGDGFIQGEATKQRQQQIDFQQRLQLTSALLQKEQFEDKMNQDRKNSEAMNRREMTKIWGFDTGGEPMNNIAPTPNSELVGEGANKKWVDKDAGVSIYYYSQKFRDNAYFGENGKPITQENQILQAQLKSRENIADKNITSAETISTNQNTSREGIVRDQIDSAEGMQTERLESAEELQTQRLNVSKELKSLEIASSEKMNAEQIASRENTVQWTIDSQLKIADLSIKSKEEIAKWNIDSEMGKLIISQEFSKEEKYKDRKFTTNLEAMRQDGQNFRLGKQLNSNLMLKQMGIDGSKMLQELVGQQGLDKLQKQIEGQILLQKDDQGFKMTMSKEQFNNALEEINFKGQVQASLTNLDAKNKAIATKLAVENAFNTMNQKYGLEGGLLDKRIGADIDSKAIDFQNKQTLADTKYNRDIQLAMLGAKLDKKKEQDAFQFQGSPFSLDMSKGWFGLDEQGVLDQVDKNLPILGKATAVGQDLDKDDPRKKNLIGVLVKYKKELEGKKLAKKGEFGGNTGSDQYYSQKNELTIDVNGLLELLDYKAPKKKSSWSLW
jgi:hypothetical protein